MKQGLPVYYQLSLAVVNAQYNRPVKQLMSRDWSTPLYRIFHIRSHKDWWNIVGRLDTEFILNPPWHNSSRMKFVQMLVNYLSTLNKIKYKIFWVIFFRSGHSRNTFFVLVFNASAIRIKGTKISLHNILVIFQNFLSSWSTLIENTIENEFNLLNLNDKITINFQFEMEVQFTFISG